MAARQAADDYQQDLERLLRLCSELQAVGKDREKADTIEKLILQEADAGLPSAGWDETCRRRNRRRK
jgi:hypothetical protein